MRKLLMLPTPAQAEKDTTNSIHQIVLRLRDHLPAHGYELVDNEKQADFVAGHAGQTYSNTQVDIAHIHGLYPTAYPNLIQQWHLAANQGVVNNLIRAKQITAPSQWVADILRRDMHIQPAVVPWAIEFDDWQPGENQGYVLWNKTRADGVCDPQPAVDLANKAGSVLFMSTFAHQPPVNMKVIGLQPYQAMRKLIQSAGVYLATTKETFGIGILEAMACEIPVLGYRHGNCPNLVQHGVTGYLVEPGDINGLAQGLDYCIQNRAVLGGNGRRIAQIFNWDNVSRGIAAVYDRLFEDAPTVKVSVVIPCYNYERYIDEAIASVGRQVTDFGVELIVVNDGSTDHSYATALEAITKLPSDQGICKAEVIEQSNMGVAAARNHGIAEAKGEYIVCLDADDKLGSPDFLQTLVDAMDKDRGVGIAFTGLQMIDEDGALGKVSEWPNGFNWDAQLSGRNQVPTCCMFRREAWRRAGGYKAQYTPAEDAELWTRIVSLGYRAVQATTAPWFLYRWHAGSLSSPIRENKRPEPDWRTDKPYVNDRIYPMAANGEARPVRNYDKPKVSIIIPVADYHVGLLPQALDSVERQTERLWECLVINDSGKPLPGLAPFPWVKVVDTDGHKGAGYARNIGIKNAIAPLIAFLDADDMLQPRFLEETIKAYQRTGRYVYTDWISIAKSGAVEPHETPNFVPGDVFQAPIRHSINILMKREWAIKVGGFSETMVSWEDVRFFMQLGAAGICGVRVPEPLTIYRYTTGQRRERGETIKQDLIDGLRNEFMDYIEGRKVCNCNNPVPGRVASETAPTKAVEGDNQLIRIAYGGPPGNVDLYGPVTRKSYGRRAGGDTFYVYAVDQRANPELFVPIAEVYEEKVETPVPPPPVPIVESVGS